MTHSFHAGREVASEVRVGCGSRPGAGRRNPESGRGLAGGDRERRVLFVRGAESREQFAPLWNGGGHAAMVANPRNARLLPPGDKR